MKHYQIEKYKLPHLVMIILGIVVLILVFNSIFDDNLDVEVVTSEIIFSAHSLHILPLNILFHCYTAFFHILNQSLSIIGIASSIKAIYSVIVIIMSVVLTFNVISLNKLISQISKLYFASSFYRCKEIIKAFIHIP